MNQPLFTLFLLVLSISSASATANIKADREFDRDELGREFIAIDEGESLELTCENFEGSHHWELPDNGDIKDFSLEDQAERVKTSVGHDSAEQILTISNAKVTDTGLYECNVEMNVAADVYVYVQKPGSFFLKPSVHGYEVDPDNYTVACRATDQHLEERGAVELYAEHELWKEASKHYDPRVGFQMTPKLMNGHKFTNAIGFECKFQSETVHLILTPKSKNNGADYKLLIEEGTEFPHVGGSLEYFCVVEGQDVWNVRHLHKLLPDCPKCKDNTTTHVNLIHNNQNEMRKRITVSNLTSQDSGLYSCQWLMEKGTDFVPMKNASRQITISPTKEQIKLLNRTQEYIEIDEGQPLKIFAVVRPFPEGTPGYTAKWSRGFARAQKGTNESEPLINDGQKSIDTVVQGKDMLETLTVPKATVNMSGKYTLDISVNGNARRTVIWTVRVRNNRTMHPRIEIASQDKWILFDQDYYKVGALLRVICVVEGWPKPEVHLTRKFESSDGWEAIEGAEAIEGTFTKGYALNVTVNDDTEYKCEGKRNGMPARSDTKKVQVSDSATEVNVAWHKPERVSSESEDKDQIYEGDRIELECIVPKTDQVTMEWMFGKDKANLAETTTVAAHSKHLIATIENATSAHSGDYTCIVTDEKDHRKTENFTRTIEITKATKPFLKGSVEKNVEVKYDNQMDLACPVEGTPEPQYRWLKNGNEVADKSQLSRNGQLLHFPRAAGQDEGTYVCQAVNRAGTYELEYKLKVKGAPKLLSGWSIFFIVLAFLVLLGCLIVAFILYTRQKKKSREASRSLQVLYEQLMRQDVDAPLLPTHGKVTMDMRVRRTAYDAKYEIDMKNLVLLEALGSGQFGSVRKGRLARGAPVSDAAAYRGPALTVAIKSPRNGSNPEDQKALIDELKILIAIDNLEETKHPNVLSLVGAVTKNMKDGQLFVVFEMCENGDLKTFLQRYKGELKDKFLNELKDNKEPATSSDDYLVPNNQVTVQYTSQGEADWQADQERDRLLGDPKTLSTSDLISFSMQIASGMDFLAGVSCIHRDLAARNCLLNANKVVKIADFGMAKNEDKGYYRMQKTNVMVPYRWMAPESMEDHTFTVESDVWSFGIVLYEIFTLGSQPYPGVPNNNLHEHLKAGQRNPRPDLCHPDIYNLMLQTWDKDVERRPSFGQCSDFMRSQLQLVNPEMLETVDKELEKNAAQIAQFDQFRGPRANAVLDEQELAALFAGQRTPVSNGGHEDEEAGERIYIKELRR